MIVVTFLLFLNAFLATAVTLQVTPEGLLTVAGIVNAFFFAEAFTNFTAALRPVAVTFHVLPDTTNVSPAFTVAVSAFCPSFPMLFVLLVLPVFVFPEPEPLVVSVVVWLFPLLF